jgi:hypothetical protein
MLKTITLLLLTVAVVGAPRLDQVVPSKSSDVVAMSQRGGLFGRWRRGPTRTTNQRYYYRGNSPSNFPSNFRYFPMMIGS